MYRHPKTSAGFYNMVEEFETRLLQWMESKGYEGHIKISNSCVFSKSIYISATKNEWVDAITIRISDHSAKDSGPDAYLWWDDYKNPAATLAAVKEKIENF